MNKVVAPETSLSPSVLWAQTWGSAPEGTPWQKAATRCVMCGEPVQQGVLSKPVTKDLFDASFTFKLDVKFAGDAVCGWCLAIWTNKWMQKSSKAFAVQGEGVYRLAKNEEIASLVLQPPSRPYVAIFNTRQQAHMIWRTPVAMPSDKAVQVRIDDELFVVDRRRVLAGIAAWQSARSILTLLGKPKAAPFLLSYDLGSVLAGVAHNQNAAAVAAHSTEGAAAITALRMLTMGEWWALSACRDVNLAQPASWPRWSPVEREAA